MASFRTLKIRNYVGGLENPIISLGAIPLVDVDLVLINALVHLEWKAYYYTLHIFHVLLE